MAANGKRALITGITGQDGSYLAELLLDKGYEVHGIIRRSASFNTERIDHLYADPHEKGARLFLHYGDLCDANGLFSILQKVKPCEVYNLGAQSHVRVSFRPCRSTRPRRWRWARSSCWRQTKRLSAERTRRGRAVLPGVLLRACTARWWRRSPEGDDAVLPAQRPTPARR